jgi:hypothetical protein
MTEEPPAVPAVPAELVEHLGRDQVFGPAVVQGDTTLVPVARVRAGAGRRPGKGGGVGVVARPLGAFRVSADGQVSWHPAVDVNRIVAGGQLALVAIVALGVLGLRRRQQRGSWFRRG